MHVKQHHDFVLYPDVDDSEVGISIVGSAGTTVELRTLLGETGATEFKFEFSTGSAGVGTAAEPAGRSDGINDEFELSVKGVFTVLTGAVMELEPR